MILAGWLLLLGAAAGLRLEAATATLLETNATWRLWKGTREASTPDLTAWRAPGFGDGAWPMAPAPFYFGESLEGGTVLSDMRTNYTTLYLRRPFDVTNAAEVTELELTATCDDGFIAWINGVEVARLRAPVDAPRFDSLAGGSAPEPVAPVGFPLVTPEAWLRTGTNLLAVQVFNVARSSSDLVFDAELTATLKDPTDPRIIGVTPVPGEVTALTGITLVFSEAVTGVDAGDLRVNDVPANGLTGAGTTWTFSFPQPEYGTVQISWDMRCGIANLGTPPVAFNPTGPGARILYELYDPSAPKLVALNPPAGGTVRQFSQVEVTFDRPVAGIDPADLEANGQAALAVVGSGAGPYVFAFAPAPAGRVSLGWADAAGIVDLSPESHVFVGAPWEVTVAPDLPPGDLLITEFMAENVTGLADENSDREDWIEIYNRGTNTVNLAGWSLTDDAREPGQWVFPAVTLGAGRYLVVFASGKDRRPTSAGARLHTNFKLGIRGEYVGLFTPESPRRAASELEFPEQRNDHSYGLDPFGQWRYYPGGSPGTANGYSRLERVVAPVHFSVSRGFFQQPFNLTLATPTPGAEIRYTLDGRVPTATVGAVYAGPIPVNATRMVRAAAFRPDQLPSRVTTHTYLYNMAASRRRLPALSLVTASNHLYGASGIMEYSPRNTTKHGIAWERPVSVELIRPEDNGGFQADCGIRIQGGGYIRELYNYRSGQIPQSKYSFRLYFRGDYGEGRLEYPLIPDCPVSSFDKVVLRAGMNDATNPFLTDEFVRRLESDAGQVSSRGTFVNLFLNGVYKGYYNPTERIDEDFLQTWHGGGPSWDIMAAMSEVRSGDTVAWNSLRRAATNSVHLEANYLALERLLDTTNFVEYLLPLVYADTDDWPHNNFRAARERVAGGRFRFYAWDAEWSFGVINGSSVNHNAIAGQLSNLAPPWGGTDIQRIFLGLKKSPEFRLLFADRVHRHFFNGGALTDDRIRDRYRMVVNLLNGTISGLNSSISNTWIKSRRRYLTNHFALAGLLASSNAPVLTPHGGRVARGSLLGLSAGVGAIHYTTNGSDPRVRFTDAVAPDALEFDPARPFALDRTTLIRARTRWGTNWSALTEATFQVDQSGLPLRIVELMYHPSGGEAYEFLELLNASGVPLDVSGVSLEGVEFRFLEGTWLAPGQRVVLIPETDPAAFARRYPGVTVFGYYRNNLSNGGERVALLDRRGRTIVSVDYSDRAGWPVAADGGGYSIEIVNPDGDPDDPANWRASAKPGGSPGDAPSLQPPPRVRLNEIAAISTPGAARDDAWVELHNPGTAPVELGGWSLSDSTGTRRYVFPAMTLEGGGYLLLAVDRETTPGVLHTGFPLDPAGDTLFLDDPSGARVDALSFGPQVAGFALGRLGGQDSWGLTEPTPGEANVAATLAPPADVVVNEILANAAASADDWIELHNRNPVAPAALEGLSLTATNAAFRLATPGFIPPAGFVVLEADGRPGRLHVDFRLPAEGGFVALEDPLGIELSRIGYTNAPDGVALGRLPDGASNLTWFPFSPTPGASNYVASWSGPRLNEVMARNAHAVTNANGHVTDWIELVNPNDAEFDLSGMSLSLDAPAPGQWTFPAGSRIPARGYLVVGCDGTRPASVAAGGELNCGRSLEAEGGGVYLYDAGGRPADRVTYGSQLVDRAIGQTGAGWALLERPTPGGPNAVPAALGDRRLVRLNEWLAESNAESDWIELHNPGPLPVDLDRCVLTDDPSLAGQTNHVILPLTFIDAGGYQLWQADGDLAQGPNHLPFRLDALGETLRLYGADGVTIDNVDLLVQQPGVAEGRFPDGQTNLVRFPVSPSPGWSNFLPLESAVINEVLAHTAAPFEDAIELYNPGNEPAAIGGWWLSNDRQQPKKYRVPDDTVLAPRGFWVFYEQQFKQQFSAASGSSPGFTLRPDLAQEVVLSAVNEAGDLTGHRCEVQFDPVEPDRSAGRHATSTGPAFGALEHPTFGRSEPRTVAEFRTGRGAPNAPPAVGPVVITELMYHPPGWPGGDADEEPTLEYLELHNLTTNTVWLYDQLGGLNSWRVAGGVQQSLGELSLPPRAYLILVPDQTGAAVNFDQYYGLAPGLHRTGPWSGRLANEGETLRLYKPVHPRPADGRLWDGDVVVDRVGYGSDLPWPPAANGTGLSLQRRDPAAYGNDPANWIAAAPTPGRALDAAAGDTDGDGLTDTWEYAHGLNLWSAAGSDGAAGDPDADGLSNLEEARLNTDPRERASAFTEVRIEANGLRLVFNGVAGWSYAIEYREALASGDWKPLANLGKVLANTRLEYVAPVPAQAAARYYRLVITASW